MPLAGGSTGGRHFLQIPGPTNVPDRVLRAMAAPDDRPPRAGVRRARPGGARGGQGAGVRHHAARWSSTRRPAPAPGRRRWSTRSRPATACSASRPATSPRCGRRWRGKLGLEVDFVPGDWRHGVDPGGRRRSGSPPTPATRSRPCCVVHNETSTGVTSRVAEVREAIDARRPPGAAARRHHLLARHRIDYRHDEWGVDVTVAGSQKGLMLPPGLGFNAVSEKALAASRTAQLPALLLGLGADPRGQRATASGPTRPATNLLYGLREALQMLARGGAAERLRPPPRHAEATRAAVRGWGLEVLCARRARALRRR